MHLLSIGSVFLTLAFLVNASPSTLLPDMATSTSPSPRAPGKCERTCGPHPPCIIVGYARPIRRSKECYRWIECMKNCILGPQTPRPCVNNDRTRDSVGWTCTDHYDHFPEDCGHYDTPYFNSYRQCCACKQLHQ